MKPGIYFDFDACRYHSDPCDAPSLNYSTAKALITESPWHAYRQHPKLGGERFDPSSKMDRGNIVHALLLKQPLAQKVHLIDARDYRKKAVQEEREAAQSAGRYVMLQREYNELTSALPLIREHLREAGVDLDGHCETTVVWSSDGIACRTRMDHVSKGLVHIDDLKCGEDVNPVKLPAHIHEMCYDLQAAVEIDAVETVRPDLVGRVTFSDVFIEMEYPYFVVRADHNESMLSVGRSKWRRAKALWNECLSTGKWPGYRNRIEVSATNWAYTREFGELA